VAAAASGRERGNRWWRNSGQRVNHSPLQYLSDKKRECANRLLVDLQGLKRLRERSGQSMVSPYRDEITSIIASSAPFFVNFFWREIKQFQKAAPERCDNSGQKVTENGNRRKKARSRTMNFKDLIVCVQLSAAIFPICF
jgi:hypothetical protein